MDLVETPPLVDPYTTLKGRLVLAHQLTPVQKAIKCLQVAASSSQRPSDVLALLLEFCPPGEEPTALFRGAFTMQLPVAIQAHLAGTELTDIKELAQMTGCGCVMAPCQWPPWRSFSLKTTATMWWPPFQPRSSSSINREATLRASRAPRADRASKWPAAMLGRASLSAGFTRGMARRPSSALTRTAVPGRETRWPGGGGRCLLWP